MRLRESSFLVWIGVASVLGTFLIAQAASMTDAQALTKAKTIYGDRAAAAVVRKAGTTSLSRCIGYTYGEVQTWEICLQGNWEAVFAAMPPAPAVKDVYTYSSGHVACIGNQSIPKTQVNTGFGVLGISKIADDCMNRIYGALVEVRLKNPAAFDAALASRGLWLNP